MSRQRGYGGKAIRRLPIGLGTEWAYTRDGIAWHPEPGVEYRIEEEKTGLRGWRAYYFARGAEYGEPVCDSKVHAYHAAEAAEAHWARVRGRRA